MPVLEVVAFSATSAKPALFAYEDGRRSFASDLDDTTVLPLAGRCVAGISGSATADTDGFFGDGTRAAVEAFQHLRGLRVESAEVLHGALWAKLSDHAPVIATLHLD